MIYDLRLTMDEPKAGTRVYRKSNIVNLCSALLFSCAALLLFVLADASAQEVQGLPAGAAQAGPKAKVQSPSTLDTEPSTLRSGSGSRPEAGSKSATATEDGPKLDARFYQQNTPFSGEVTRGILVAKDSQFSFVMPPNFRRQVDAAEKKISLTSTSYTCAITAKIYETATDGQADLKPDTLRARVLGQHKDAKLVDEFNASIESMSGPAFEVEWASEMGQKMTTRAAFVPYATGHIEFTVQAPTSEIRQYDQSLNQLLLSIRTSPVGKELAVQEFLSEL